MRRDILLATTFWIFLVAPAACSAGLFVHEGRQDCHDERHGACTDDPCHVVATTTGGVALDDDVVIAPLQLPDEDPDPSLRVRFTAAGAASAPCGVPISSLSLPLLI